MDLVLECDGGDDGVGQVDRVLARGGRFLGDEGRVGRHLFEDGEVI